MTEPLPDRWATQDYPVLRRVAELVEIEHADEVRAEDIAGDLGMTTDDALRSLVDLHKSEYIEGVRSRRVGPAERHCDQADRTGPPSRGHLAVAGVSGRQALGCCR